MNANRVFVNCPLVTAYCLLPTAYCFLLFAVCKNNIIRQQQRPNRDTCVCYIERWPVVLPGVQRDEVDYISESRAVRQVSQNTSQQQRTRTEHPIVISRRAQKIVKDPAGSQRRQHHEEPPTKRSGTLHLAKRYPGVLRINQIEKTRDNCAVIAVSQSTRGPGLRDLVHHVNTEGAQQITCAPAKAC